MKYLTSKDYPELCASCKRSIDDAHGLIVMGFVDESYIDDPEGPSMLAYDKRWLCDDDCYTDLNIDDEPDPTPPHGNTGIPQWAEE